MPLDALEKEQKKFMAAALAQAAVAAQHGDVPVGAVVVKDGKIIARGRNRREQRHDPTAHAEMEALKKAAKKLGGWYLHGCTLYVTLEPCPMCAGALMQARIESVVFGAYDPKAGCCGSLLNLPQDTRFPHRPVVTGGVMEQECAAVLKEFFKMRRGKKESGLEG
jgi:tRNA(adenine34) deaminase